MCVSELESLWPFSILGMLYHPDPMCLAFETSLNVSICCWLVTQIEWTGSDMHVIGRLQPTNWGAETGHGGCHSWCRKYSEWHQCTDTALCCHQAGRNMPSKSFLICTCFVSLTTSNGILFYVLAWIHYRFQLCLQICGERILAPRGMHGTLGAARSYSSLVAPFYVFPCEHAFHADCLTDYVIKHTDKSEVFISSWSICLTFPNWFLSFLIL